MNTAEKLFTVVKVTPTTDDKGVTRFITTFQRKVQKTNVPTGFTDKNGQPIMGTISHQETYYQRLNAEMAIGTETPIDFSLYDVKERPFNPDNRDSDMKLKWLFLKD